MPGPPLTVTDTVVPAATDAGAVTVGPDEVLPLIVTVPLVAIFTADVVDANHRASQTVPAAVPDGTVKCSVALVMPVDGGVCVSFIRFQST